MRRVSLLAVAVAAAVAGAFLPTAGARLLVETPDETDGAGWRISGYAVDLSDPEVASTAGRAAADSVDLTIHAVNVTFPSEADLSGIPFLRIFAHFCTGATAHLVVDGKDGTTTPPVPQPALRGRRGTQPAAAANGTSGAYVTLFCVTVDRGLRLTVRAEGGNGAPGGAGGAGGDGVNGTPSTEVRCTDRISGDFNVQCTIRPARMGALSTSGGRGGDGGAGGAAGDGGIVSLFTAYRNWSPIVRTSAGQPGNGGEGGTGGAAGEHFDEWQGESSSCYCNWRARRRGLTRRPPVSAGSAGSAGPRGQVGKTGTVLLWHHWTSNVAPDEPAYVTPDHVRTHAALLETYLIDASVAAWDAAAEALNVTAAPAVAVADSLATFVPAALPSPEAAPITSRAAMARARIASGAGYFGRGPSSREAPAAAAAALPPLLTYATDVARVITDATSVSALAGVLRRAADVTIPAVDYGALQSQLRSRRTLLVRGADSLAGDMKAAMGEATTGLVEAQEEKERKDALATVDLVLGVLISGAGVIGESKAFGTVAKSTRDLTAKAIREFLKGTVDLKRFIQRVRPRSCTFEGILDILERGSDLATWTGFPATADWDTDVAAVEKSRLGSRAEELTAELECAFFTYRYRSQPRVNAAFRRFFIAAGARMDVIAQIVDIDVERKRLNIEQAGVAAQRSKLATLRNDIRSQTSLGPATRILRARYEAARSRALDGLAAAADAYRLASLSNYRSTVAAYARRRLMANGVESATADATSLRRVANALSTAFRSRTRCMGDELPARTYVWWELNADTAPDFAASPLAPGRDAAFVLAPDVDCARGGGTSPPLRGAAAPVAGTACALARRVNARVLSLAVELIGANASSVPAAQRALPVSLHQMGVQTFRRSSTAVTRVSSRGLHMPLHDVPVAEGGAGALSYRRVCAQGSDRTAVEQVQACPSPYAAYLLRVGTNADSRAAAYLASVQAVRVHARVASWSERCGR